MTESQVMIVTGGSRGIGAATARLAAERGYDVGVNYLGNAEGAEAVVREIETAGRRAIAVQGDVAREDDVAHHAFPGHGRNRHEQIDAVEQRPRELAAIAADLGLVAAALPARIATVAAGAGVHCGHQLKPRR